MPNYDWSAIVYARTYEVDFRFIAIPEGYNNDDISDIEPYVLTSTRLADELPRRWRWSLIRNKQQCVFGVTCMASDLIEAAGPVGAGWKEMTCDNTRVRRLYLFAGYVSNHGSAIVPTFDKLELSVFAPLYQYIAERWFVKSYDESARKAIVVPYEKPTWAAQDTIKLDEENSKLSELFIDLKKAGDIFLIPDSDGPRQQKIWNTAAQQAVETSICFGLHRERDALDSPLLIASLPITREAKRRRRPTDLVLQSAESSLQDEEQVKPIPGEQIRDKSQAEHYQDEGKDIYAGERRQGDRFIQQTKAVANEGVALLQKFNALFNEVSQTGKKMLQYFSSEEKIQNSESVAPPPDFIKKSSDQGDIPERTKNEPQSPWDLD